MEKTITVKIKIPEIPNYISADEGLLPIEDFTTGELNEIGKEWTKELIEKADKNRQENLLNN